MATWTLGEALESALASILNEVGEGDVGASPDAVNVAKSQGKEAGTDKAPASQEVVSTRRGKLKTASVTTQPGKAPASRGNAKGRRAHPHELAPLGARQPLVLVVDNGGRPATSGGTGRAAYAQARGGNPASNLKLVSAHAAPRSMID